MAVRSPVETYTNRRVTYRYCGQTLRFDLSQGLFSSFDVDAGTKFLLKAVAGQVDLPAVKKLADLGCGTGVMGTAVVKAAGNAKCVFQDRDALALEFARSNCRLNGVGGMARFIGGLGMQEVGESGFDLILSNLPAKAGLPVLHQLIHEIVGRLAGGGVGGVVIVSPLADQVGGMLARCGAEVFFTEDRREHRVYLFRRRSFGGDTMPASGASPADYLKAYIRGRKPFSRGEISYEMDTAFNLPDFDTLGNEISIAMDCLDSWLEKNVMKTGNVLVWNPGQGHVPVHFMRRVPGFTADRFIFASRDALSLEITRRNVWMTSTGLRAAPPAPVDQRGAAAAGPRILHVPSAGAVVEGIGELSPPEGAVATMALLFPHPVRSAEWEEGIQSLLDAVLVTGGIVIAGAGSTDIHRLLKTLHGMVLQQSRKYHGSRVVVLKKEA